MKNLLFFFCLMAVGAQAQKMTSEQSKISFFSKAAIEDIKAENIKSTSIFNAATGEVAFSVTIKDFEFEKSLMKEHFNEKYLESEKYPKSVFVGKISGYDSKISSVQNATAKGKLTIHGQEREVTIPGTIEWKGDGKVTTKAVFKVKLQDYKIKIPKMLWQNIAEEIEVTIEFNYKL